MQQAMESLGFSLKEIVAYRYLLDHGRQTAAVVAAACGEKRANTYGILDNLVEKGIVETDDSQAVRTYRAAHPGVLHSLAQEAQARQASVTNDIKLLMPQLTAAYNLATDKPGVVYMQGSEGFMTLLEDMARSTTEVLLVASNRTPSDPVTLKRFRELLAIRKSAGVTTRAIFHHNAREIEFVRIFAERGMQLRFLGDNEYTGELVIYEDNVVFTVYEPSLIVTILTNQTIAVTMRQLFEQLWQGSDDIPARPGEC